MWLAHALTLARIPLAAAFWMLATRPVWALAVLATAGVTDLVDGDLARRARRRGATRWATTGAWLDPLCDKTFAIVVLAALAVRRDVEVALLLLIGARELVLVPLALLHRLTPLHARVRVDYRSAPAGKHATIAQFVAIAALVAGAPGTTALALVAALVGLHAALRYLVRAREAARAALRPSAA